MWRLISVSPMDTISFLSAKPAREIGPLAGNKGWSHASVIVRDILLQISTQNFVVKVKGTLRFIRFKACKFLKVSRKS